MLQVLAKVLQNSFYVEPISRKLINSVPPLIMPGSGEQRTKGLRITGFLWGGTSQNNINSATLVCTEVHITEAVIYLDITQVTVHRYLSI